MQAIKFTLMSSESIWTRGLHVEARIFKFLLSKGIDSKETIPSAYVACMARAGTTTLFLHGSEPP